MMKSSWPTTGYKGISKAKNRKGRAIKAQSLTYLDNILRSRDSFLDLLCDCVDGINQDLASTSPNENVVGHGAEFAEPGVVCQNGLIVVIELRTTCSHHESVSRTFQHTH